ncbi:MAG: hypothetical protein AAGH43_06110 [Pseudomonadota bacterium]
MALTKSKKIVSAEGVSRALDMKGSTTAHRGGMAVLDANGFAAPATAATNLTAVGVFDESVVNDGADGAAKALIKRGTFLMKNDGASAVTRADVGQDCFIVDDETVSSDGTGTSRAGTVFDVTDTGVFVTI